MTFFVRGATRIALVLSALVILGLAIAPASATGTAHAGNLTASHGYGSGYHFAANSSYRHTGAGVNLTACRPGNATHVKKTTGFAPNATIQKERLQAFATTLQKQGVDVSALQTAIASNDTAAEKTWMTSYMASHKRPVNNTTRQQWHPWSATVSKSA